MRSEITFSGDFRGDSFSSFLSITKSIGLSFVKKIMYLDSHTIDHVISQDPIAGTIIEPCEAIITVIIATKK